MKDDLILSPMQKKEIEESIAKELEAKKVKFIEEVRELEVKHGLKIQAIISSTPAGILPQIVLIEHVEPKSK